MVFGCMSPTEQAAKINAVMPKLKLGGGGFLAHMYAYIVFWKIVMFWFFNECLKILRRVHFTEHSVCWQNSFAAYSVCGQ